MHPTAAYFLGLIPLSVAIGSYNNSTEMGFIVFGIGMIVYAYVLLLGKIGKKES